MRTPSGVWLVATADSQAPSNTAPLGELVQGELDWQPHAQSAWALSVRQDDPEVASGPTWLVRLAEFYRARQHATNGELLAQSPGELSFSFLEGWLSAQPRASPPPEDLRPTRVAESATHVSECPEAWFDPQLTETQRDLVRRALQAKAGFLIQGPPASGKTRLVVELVRQCLRRRQRVVVTAVDVARLQRFMQRLGEKGEVLAVYVADREQGEGRVCEEMSRWSAPTQAQALAARVQKSAETFATIWERELARWRQVLQTLHEAEHAAEIWAAAEAHRRNLHQQREQLLQKCQSYLQRPDAIEETELQEALGVEKRKHDEVLADLQQRSQQALEQLHHARTQWELWCQRLAYQERVVAVKRQRAFWCWLWWRTLFQARSEQRLAEFQARVQEAAAEVQRCQQECERLADAQQREHHRHALAQEQIIKAFLERHSAELAAQLQVAEGQSAEALGCWHDCRQSLERLWPEIAIPEVPQLEAVRTLRTEARSRQQVLEQQLAEVRRLFAQLPHLVEAWAQHLPEWAPVLVAPVSVLVHHPSLRRTDWMIVLDAHRLPEPTWQTLREGSARWVLCGEPNGQSENGAAPQPRMALYSCWDEVGGGTLLPPARWWQTASTITCQMTARLLAQPIRTWTEPLADQPEVTLRFFELADGRCELGEVLFPSSKFDIRQAKVFLARQLDQAMLWPGTLSGRWREDESAVYLEWRAAAGTVRVDYGRGVVEELLATPGLDGRTTWRSVRLRFDKTHGWTVESAQNWLREWSNLEAGPHTGWLWCWHGGTPPLGDWPNWVMGLDAADSGLSGVWRIPAAKNRREPARKRSEADEVLDLASVQRKRLPLAWQCLLPARGHIYPQHAREVLRHVRDWLPALLERANTWAVVGWWDKPQLELLRLLAREELPPSVAEQWHWLAVEQCGDAAAEGVLVVVDSLRYWPHGVHWYDWIRLGAIAQRCIVLLEPDYSALFRQLNARKSNPIWLTELLQQMNRLPICPMPTAAAAPVSSASS